MVRRNITLPASFANRLEALKKNRAATSDSEVIRQMIAIMELITSTDSDVILREKGTGKEREILIP
jgi:transcriptional regulator with GAF, ATPase, and Fis domain